MIKISITGKANSGKNTTAKLLVKELGSDLPAQFIAFADPIKRIAHQAFPKIPRKWLYGSSQFRNQVIPGAFKNGVPLTVRQLLIDIGNDFGRRYDPEIWINNFNLTYQKICGKQLDQGIVIATDVRRVNEYNFLKELGFYHIRILRNNCSKIDDISETDQDGILDSQFDAVIHNDLDKKHLKKQVKEIAAKIKE